MEVRDTVEGLVEGTEISATIHGVVSSSDGITGTDMMCALVPLSEQLVEFFKSTVEQCFSVIQRDSNSLRKHCQVLQRNMESISRTVASIRAFNESENDLNSSVCVVLDTSFKITLSTLSFCKEVELNHAHIFDSIANHIGPLFKTSFTLLKVSSECVEAINPLLIPEEDHRVVNQVLHSLLGVARLVLKFDPSLILLAWKALGKLICRLKDHTHILTGNGLSLDAMATDICEAMRSKSEECVKSASRSDKEGLSLYNKLLKTCRFFATMIIKIVQEYKDFHYQLALSILEFLLQLIRILPSYCSHYVGVALSVSKCAEIESNVSVVLEPLFISFMNCEQFLQCLTTPTVDNAYPQLILLCIALRFFQKLDDSSRLYLLEETSSQCNKEVSCRLLSSLAYCLKECHVELSLPVYVPGIVEAGSPSHMVTLYEHLVTLLSTVLASLPPVHFNTVEAFLLHLLVDGDDVYCSLLAQDVWCFIARWGSSDLCFSHVIILVKLLMSLPESVSMATLNIKSLVGRLLSFTTPAQQRVLVQQYPPQDPHNLKLWTTVSISSFDSEIQGELCRAVYESSAAQLGSSPLLAYYSIQCLNNLFSEPNLKPHLPIRISSTLLELLIMMLNGMTLLKKDNELHVLVAYELLQLFSSLLPILNIDHLVTVLSTLSTICHKGPPVCVLVGVANFLSQCGTLKSKDILKPICSCFLALLSHTYSWMVRTEALEAFRQFAEVTPHADILEDCIPPAMSEIVVEYLQKIPHNTKGNPQLLDHTHIVPLLTALIERRKTEQAPPTAEQQPTQVITLDDEDVCCSKSLLELLRHWDVIKKSSERLSCEDLVKLKRLHKEVDQYLDNCL